MSRPTTKKKRYINYETQLVFEWQEWQSYYNDNIDHSEYESFSDWWYDMMKMNLLAEI